jgi:uncharacterized protein YukE
MANLDVTPEYLEKLAKKQDDAATEASAAAAAADGTGTWCWVNHGVISGASNSAFGGAESARSAAGKALRQASVDLAAKLRTAKETYTGVDDDLSKPVDKQVLPK